jgi:phosphoglycerate dehydrogenase-like enzyme
VKVVQAMMAGVDWILPWLPKDITLCDGRGIHDISTSEWVLSAILASLKRIPAYRDLQNQHEWRGQASVRDDFASEGGVQTGQYRILGEDLAGKSVLIVGYGSIGSAIESRLAPFGVSVTRIARSARQHPRVHPATLLDALNQHKIRAALDVTDPEPLPPDHPLWSAPNCLITPHVAGSTPEFIHRAFRFGAAQLRRYIAGEPLENIVTSAGY